MQKNITGFTLFELMITIAVISLVFSVGVPMMKTFVVSNRLVTQANELIGAMAYARSEAVKRNKTVTICRRKIDSKECGGTTAEGWKGGWLIFENKGSNMPIALTDADILRIYKPLSGNNYLNGGTKFPNYISYLPNGRSNTNGTFTLCAYDAGSDNQQNIRKLIVSNTGRARVERDKCATTVYSDCATC